MGFLDQSTNNIILDTVLTDRGRELLARNDGSFSVVKFAVDDSEVDYSIIAKYGRTVGKEKIEKNTPIFEAVTNGNLAQKYKLVSLSNPNLIRLPNLTFTGEGVDTTNNLLTIGQTTVKTRRITVSQEIQDETSIDVELRDQAFVVEMSNLFLQIDDTSPDAVSSQQRATYLLTRDAGETATGGSRLSFTIRTKAITEAQYQIYGAPSNKSIINTFVRVSGIQSGAVLEYQVQINKSS